MKRHMMRIGLFLLSLTLAGCTLIGLGFGLLSDAAQRQEKSLPGWKVDTLKVGAKIEVFLDNGSILSGYYRGMEAVPAEEYAQLYAASLQGLAPDLHFPNLEEQVQLTFAAPKLGGPDVVLESRFHGFAPNAIVFTALWQGDARIQKKSLYELVHLRTKDGGILQGNFIRTMVRDGSLPVQSRLSIFEPATQQQHLLPLGEIQQIHHYSTAHNGALTGFILGAAIDAAIIIAAANDQTGPSRAEGENDLSSCPFVYSFDGEKYVLDSESFGGAIFHAAQRTDLDNLDHLQEVQGRYRLKLTNELQETQFVDEMRLLVLDHPQSTQVVPSFAGKLHTFAAPQPPQQATTLRGAEVRGLIAAKDERVWVSNPFGRDPEDKSQARDGLLVEFARPVGAQAAKLLCNLQNTLWASYLQGQLLALQGRELAQWYAQLNDSPAARAALLQAMVREGMLRVHVWNGLAWQEAGFFWEVGPSVPKDQALWLDLSHVPEEVVRIKLESTAGFWMINNIAIDYSPDAEVIVTALLPERARDHRGRDQRAALAHNDGQYYAMPTTQDWAELTFAAPPLRTGYARSVVLQSSGYYEIHVRAAGEPQHELVQQLMTEPGAYGQYTLRVLQQYQTALNQQE